eukprot:PhF_6_TR8727/c0_g1_i1/m.13715
MTDSDMAWMLRNKFDHPCLHHPLGYETKIPRKLVIKKHISPTLSPRSGCSDDGGDNVDRETPSPPPVDVVEKIKSTNDLQTVLEAIHATFPERESKVKPQFHFSFRQQSKELQTLPTIARSNHLNNSMKTNSQAPTLDVGPRALSLSRIEFTLEDIRTLSPKASSTRKLPRHTAFTSPRKYRSSPHDTPSTFSALPALPHNNGHVPHYEKLAIQFTKNVNELVTRIHAKGDEKRMIQALRLKNHRQRADLGDEETDVRKSISVQWKEECKVMKEMFRNGIQAIHANMERIQAKKLMEKMEKEMELERKRFRKLIAEKFQMERSSMVSFENQERIAFAQREAQVREKKYQLFEDEFKIAKRKEMLRKQIEVAEKQRKIREELQRRQEEVQAAVTRLPMDETHARLTMDAEYDRMVLFLKRYLESTKEERVALELILSRIEAEMAQVPLHEAKAREVVQLQESDARKTVAASIKEVKSKLQSMEMKNLEKACNAVKSKTRSRSVPSQSEISKFLAQPISRVATRAKLAISNLLVKKKFKKVLQLLKQ